MERNNSDNQKSFWPTREQIIRPKEDYPLYIAQKQAEIGNTLFSGLKAEVRETRDKSYSLYIGDEHVFTFWSKDEGEWYPIMATSFSTSPPYTIENPREFREYIRQVLRRPKVLNLLRKIVLE